MDANVLFVEDDRSIREVTTLELRQAGFRVTACGDGREGLDAFAQRQFDLVLLDFALPDRNGLEILKDIRERDPNMSVIMITAYGTVDNAVKAMQGGAQNFGDTVDLTEVGSGVIDWKKIFAQSDKAGIKYYIVEHDHPKQPFESIKTSYDYLSKLTF